MNPVEIKSSPKKNPIYLNLSSSTIESNNSIKQSPIEALRSLATNNNIKQSPIQALRSVASNNNIKQSPIQALRSAVLKIPSSPSAQSILIPSNNNLSSSSSAEHLLNDPHVVDNETRLFLQIKPILLPSVVSSQATTVQSTPCTINGMEDSRESFQFSKYDNQSVVQSPESQTGSHSESPPRLQRALDLEPPTTSWTQNDTTLEHPPLLHIFDMALDEVYVNMLVQDYPRFCTWDQTERSSRSGNMANLFLHGDSTSNNRTPRTTETIEDSSKPCCCIIC